MNEARTSSRFELRWRADRIQSLMHRQKIADRSHLAGLMNVARVTVYQAFGADWSGKATAGVLADLAGLMGVKPDSVAEVVESHE